MVKRGLGLLVVLAAIAAIVGVSMAPGTQPTHRTIVRPMDAPSVNVAPGITCEITGETCSIHPCVEFVARAQALSRGRVKCDPYPKAVATAHSAPSRR